MLALLAVASFARFMSAGLAQTGVPAWFHEELTPMVGLLNENRPIAGIDQRQYGVTANLIMDLPIRLSGSDITVRPAFGLVGPNVGMLATYALITCVIGATGAYLLFGWRFFGLRRRAMLLLAIFWFNFTPLAYDVAQRSVDLWQVFFLTLALVLFTWPPGVHRWSAVPLAAATLTKLLPGLLAAFVLVRNWRAGLWGIAAGLGLLGIGQVLYGTLMGFGYPIAILTAGGGATAAWSTHYENNSLRGLIFKLGAAFRLEPDSRTYIIDPGLSDVLSIVAYGLMAAMFVYVLWVAWQSRNLVGSPERRAIEFCLAIATMLLVSPHTAQEYTVALLPVFGVMAWLVIRGYPRRWGYGMMGIAAVSTLLVGIFLPLSIVGRVLPLELLLRATGNAENTFFTEQVGVAIGAYHFFGFIGVGMLMTWGLLVWLEIASRSDPAGSEAAKA